MFNSRKLMSALAMGAVLAAASAGAAQAHTLTASARAPWLAGRGLKLPTVHAGKHGVRPSPSLVVTQTSDTFGGYAGGIEDAITSLGTSFTLPRAQCPQSGGLYALGAEISNENEYPLTAGGVIVGCANGRASYYLAALAGDQAGGPAEAKPGDTIVVSQYWSPFDLSAQVTDLTNGNQAETYSTLGCDGGLECLGADFMVGMYDVSSNRAPVSSVRFGSVQINSLHLGSNWVQTLPVDLAPATGLGMVAGPVTGAYDGAFYLSRIHAL